MEVSREQWERVKHLYAAALECSSAERNAFLQHNEQDNVVRQEVRRLLDENADLGSFLSTPAFVDRRLSSTHLSKLYSPGDMLAGRFRVVNFIAAGGMGEVYKAEDTRLDRLVVLKFLPTELADDRQSLDRFRREAKAASALNHPNICTVYDFGEDSGRAFIAMEFVEGETLAARITKGRIPIDQALPIAIQIASGLGAAHRKAIVHRDLKPGNVMVTETGAMLLDFGLAKYHGSAIADEGIVSILTEGAQVVGTLPYMSPEQLQGKEVDVRSDIFAFGAVLYEMLSGTRAFQRRSNIDTVAAIDHEEPKPLQQFIKDLPDEIVRVVQRCLRKLPDQRYTSVLEIERDLEFYRATTEGITGTHVRAMFRQARRPRVAIPILFIILLLVVLIGWRINHSFRVKWAREQALPRISQLVEEDNVSDAYALALEAERFVPDDPMLVKLWPQISWSGSIHTTPSGASVFRRDYNSPNSEWVFVGHSPIDKQRFPLVDAQWKFELKGFTTVEQATFPEDESMNVTMGDEAKDPAGMVRVDMQTSPAVPTTVVTLEGLAGYEASPAVPLSSYWIGKYEVTNSEFKRFVDNRGYQKEQYWKYPFIKGGRKLSWVQAMTLFRDRTGRPGPATWTQGKYPQGQDDFPVTGISWFEAAAYAEFVGKSLPTIYHWAFAASPWYSSSIIPASNFGGRGPARVGNYRGMSQSGAYDMAGNVKEWCLNEGPSGTHYILGGAWDEPNYMFNDADARSSLDRIGNFGVRLAKYSPGGVEPKAAAAISLQPRNYGREHPVSDRVFELYKRLYSYDKTPLNALLESTQETADWKMEKITYDAAYGNERITAFLYLPNKSAPPYQSVVFFPASGAVRMRSSKNLEVWESQFDFVIKSGRAVIFPVYKSTFERGDGLMIAYPNMTSSYRDHVIAWSKDLSRSIDYLESRPDIDHDRLAYDGVSWGAAMGAIFPAVDDRFRALVLVGPGFYLQHRLPEVDQINFAPRVKAPVLMLNGRFDFLFPVRSSQEPMFLLLGTPKQQKRHVLYDSGHDIPSDPMMKETLDWLDRYLGEVK